MNIFVLHKDPSEAVKHLCDKHVPKMVLETAQLLCSPHEDAPYKRTHYNHPCSKWVRASKTNYVWLLQYGRYLAEEYDYRFNREHKSAAVIEWCWRNIDNLDLPDIGLTPFVQAMPDEYHNDDPVKAYRSYYFYEKKRFAKWQRRRLEPSWWTISKLFIR